MHPKGCCKEFELKMYVNVMICVLKVEELEDLGTRRLICLTIHRYEKAISKYMKNYHKNNESSYFKSWNGNLYGWAMLEKFPVNKFE